METRDRPIRAKIISLVVAPFVALLALWIFATTLTAGPALNLLHVQTLYESVGEPGEVLTAALQQERRLTATYLAGTGDGAELGLQRGRTDRAVADFRAAAGSDAARDAADDELDARIDATFAALDSTAAVRGRIDRREVDVDTALTFYSEVVDVVFRMFLGSATFNDPQVDRGIRAVTTLGRGREWLSRTDARLAAAFTARRLSDADHARLIGSISTQRFLYAEATADLTFEDRAAFEKVTGAGAFTRLVAMQDAVVAAGPRPGPIPVEQQAWQSAFSEASEQLRTVEIGAAARIDDLASPIAVGILARLGVAALVGLAALVVSAVVAVRVGRSLIGRLGRLRADALDLAGHRLPEVVRRLRAGERVDVDAEAPPLHYGKDEIGQVGHAFSEVQRTAVRSAIQEADVRRGLNEVFLNIARRSQALLHRQLALLDTMERRATDPQELEDLYQVDHLATRMRRHAEDLVILAGATPGRGWRHPVAVIDVVRGAISEVEDYRRIDLTAIEPAAVAGRAVGDVIHLLAELLENAASFSPPNTRVRVAGQSVPNGYAVEIEDRGLGMSTEAIDEANARLLAPPPFDPADSARLGLFVVARLGARHGVHVQLRRSAYGGVTAVALLPPALIDPESADRPVDTPAVPAERTLTVVESTGPAPVGSSRRRRATTPPAVVSGIDRVHRQPSDGVDDVLPQRVRSATVPHPVLDREAGPVADAARSPEAARSLMSALQSGTAAGRRAAMDRAVAGPVPVGGPAPKASGTGWADAATAAFPLTGPAASTGPGDGPDDFRAEPALAAEPALTPEPALVVEPALGAGGEGRDAPGDSLADTVKLDLPDASVGSPALDRAQPDVPPVTGPTAQPIATDHITTAVQHGAVLPAAPATPGREPASGDEDA